LGNVPRRNVANPRPLAPAFQYRADRKTADPYGFDRWHAKVHGITNVRAELDGVVALRTRPVVYKLELLFAFGERAIATGSVQTIAKGVGTTVVVTQLTVHPTVVAVVGEEETEKPPVVGGPGRPVPELSPGNPSLSIGA